MGFTATGSIIVHHIPRWLIPFAAILGKYAVFKEWIAWDAMGAPRGKKLLPAHYGFIHYEKSPNASKFYDLRAPHQRCVDCQGTVRRYGGRKNRLHPFGAMVSDIWTDIPRLRNKHSRLKGHPCQLPGPIMDRLILMTTDPGDLVLDPFLGIGATATAAKRMGRHYLGFEINPDFAEAARQEVALTQPTQLGGRYVSHYGGRLFTIRDEDWPFLSQFFEGPAGGAEIEHTPVQLTVDLVDGRVGRR